MLQYGLIGDGYIAKRHREAIEATGGKVKSVYDPIKAPGVSLDDKFFDYLDYVVICSPTNFHRSHTNMSLKHGCKVIVEKPAVMPWEPLIDDDRVNVVLQLRYAHLPDKANTVYARMVRDSAYFKTWKGDYRLTGGVFYSLFIHYVDMAIRMGAEFIGELATEGPQIRRIDDGIDLMGLDMQAAYNAMYQDIITGGGIKPADLFFLNYVMQACIDRSGCEAQGMKIYIPKNLFPIEYIGPDNYQFCSLLFNGST
jgi:predicted dehydrogenase